MSQLDPQVQSRLLNLNNNTDYTDPYSISLPLLASALQDEPDSYEQHLTNMLSVLTDYSEYGCSKSLWMLGRILMATDLMEDPRASMIAKEMQELLISLTEDNFAVWGRGYLLAYNAKHDIDNYHAAINDYIEACGHLLDKNIVDGIWAVVLGFNATALAKDEKSFLKLESLAFKKCQVSSVEKLLELIPIDDFQSWAIAITEKSYRSFSLDTDRLSDLLAISLGENKNDGDFVIASLEAVHR